MEEEEQKEEKPMLLNAEEEEKINKLLQLLKDWDDGEERNDFFITDLNSYLRRYMYLKLEKDFAHLVTKSEKKSRFESNIRVKKMTKTEKEKFKQQKKKDKEEEFNRKIGFSRVFKLLLGKQIPFIGHNPFYDLLFLYSHFIEELPKTYREFKKKIHQLFPLYALTFYSIYHFIIEFMTPKPFLGKKKSKSCNRRSCLIRA